MGVSGQASAFSFAYNGLGDRLRQSVDGSSEQHTLDLNRGLTQVLADGESSYLYGRSAGSGPGLRLGEQGADGWQYHLGDALGSVRNLADGSAEVTSARAYEPFGVTLTSTGPGATNYGFTGEWLEPSGLIHLRARYLEPAQGRFFQPDAWAGDNLRPKALNGYAYRTNNPINNSDPSGRVVCFGGVDPATGECRPGPFATLLPPWILQTSLLPRPDLAVAEVIGICVGITRTGYLAADTVNERIGVLDAPPIYPGEYLRAIDDPFEGPTLYQQRGQEPE